MVAATSRPDLIDAALLRPGRLDRLVYCGFPSPGERGAVLSALASAGGSGSGSGDGSTSGLQLATDVDLARVGYAAEYCSGADLGALLAEAQLAAVHEVLAEAEAEKAGGGAGVAAAVAPRRLQPAVIQQRHLEAALEAARPSVPEAERQRLEAIYARFRGDREGSGGGAAAAVDRGKGKLVTWA